MSDPVTFDSATARLAFPLLFAGQAQKEFFVNEALIRADIVVQCVVEGEAGSPPAAPAAGQAWLVGDAPTGAFAGRAGAIAGWTGDGWRFVAPQVGYRVYDKASASFRHFTDAWQLVTAPDGASGGTTIDVEARAALVRIIEKLVDAGVFAAS